MIYLKVSCVTVIVVHTKFWSIPVTRSLYTARNVLHRDISDGNVLFTAEPVVYQRSCAATSKSEMCFIQHMLDTKYASTHSLSLLIAQCLPQRGPPLNLSSAYRL